MNFAVLRAGLQGRDFLSLHDFNPQEIAGLLEVAAAFKNGDGPPQPILPGKSIGLIFRKPSTRTRVSFEAAVWQLGGHPLFLSAADLQLGRGETIADTGQVLSRYLDALVVRTFSQQELVELAAAADIPVINGLTDLLHPCQVLADLLTIQERFGKLAGLRLAYLGDANNMAHSLLLGGAKTGMDVTIVCPPAYMPDAGILAAARADARETGATLQVVHEVAAGVRGADVIYTDVWVSMGQEGGEEKIKTLTPYQVNAEVLRLAAPGAIVMHCLPAHRGQEITAEVIDGPQSAVWDEAENRLHVQKAILGLAV